MLSRPGEIVRRHDPDRFLCALFAPPEKRETLFTLYAFNHELARAREAVREPMMALIRLQWWREVVEGADKSHEVATPLRQAIGAGALRADTLLPVIDAREAETDIIPTLADWLAYHRAGAGGIAAAAAEALGAHIGVLDAARNAGAAYGIAGVLRSTRALAAQGRCLLPADVLAEAGLSPEAVAAAPEAPALLPVLDRLAQHGRAMLPSRRSAAVPRSALAALLPAVLARRDLRHPGQDGPRGLSDRLAVTLAAMRGRV